MHCTLYGEGETLDLLSRRVREVTARTGGYGLHGGLQPVRGLRSVGGVMVRNLAKVRFEDLHGIVLYTGQGRRSTCRDGT